MAVSSCHPKTNELLATSPSLFTLLTTNNRWIIRNLSRNFTKLTPDFNTTPSLAARHRKHRRRKHFRETFPSVDEKLFFIFPFSDLKNVFWTSVLVKFDVDGNRSRFLAPILKRWKRKITLWRPKSKISVDANFFCPLQESQRRDSPEKRWLSLLEMFNGTFFFGTAQLQYCAYTCWIEPW